MRILIVGAGTVGSAVAAALRDRHELVLASLQKGSEQVDISSPDSIRALFQRVGRVDAVVSAAGRAVWKPLGELTDADFELCFRNKLMGQVNLLRFGLDFIADHGSFTWSSFRDRMLAMNSTAASLANSDGWRLKGPSCNQRCAPLGRRFRG